MLCSSRVRSFEGRKKGIGQIESGVFTISKSPCNLTSASGRSVRAASRLSVSLVTRGDAAVRSDWAWLSSRAAAIRFRSVFRRLLVGWRAFKDEERAWQCTAFLHTWKLFQRHLMQLALPRRR